jgi:hypothetical protein
MLRWCHSYGLFSVKSGYPAPICLLHDSPIRNLACFTDEMVEFEVFVRDLPCFTDGMLEYELLVRNLACFTDGTWDLKSSSVSCAVLRMRMSLGRGYIG